MTDSVSPSPNPSPAHARGEGDIGAIPAIISDVIRQQRALHPDRPVLIGVAGAQGSGKTTACQQLVAANARFANFSIDDVYLDTEQRLSWRRGHIRCSSQEVRRGRMTSRWRVRRLPR